MRPFIAILTITVALICLAMAQNFNFVPTQSCSDNSNFPASTAYVHNCAGGGGGSGTVTSVGISMPTGFATSGTPVTTSGTFGVTWNGTIPPAQLPTPSATTLGGVESGSAPTNQFMTGISTAGAPQFSQPSFSNLVGIASNAQIPPPTAIALGGVETITCAGGQFVNVINASGVPSCSTPAGGGNVSTSGTITSGECAQWNSTTTLISTAAPCGSGNVSTSGTITTGRCAQWASATTILSISGPCSSGTVTSVGISVPTGLAVSGSPVTTAGTIALSWSGTIPNAQIPNPTTGALGGVESVTCGGGQFVSGINTSGIPGCSTPAGGGNVSTSGTITSGNCAQWNSTTTLVSTGTPCGSGGGGTSLGYFSIATYATGPIGDGTCHPLSSQFGSLGAAQAVYPFVSDLTQCIDWAASQQAINQAFLVGPGANNSAPVFCPAGNYQLSNPLFFDAANNSQGSAAAWASGTTYANGATVTYNGIPWQSMGSGNIGNPPTSVHGKPGNINTISVSGSPTGVPTATVAVSSSSPAIVSYNAPGFVGVVAGQPVVFSTQQYNVQPGNVTPALPTGINPNQVYYVLATGLTTSQFEISATPGGAAINTSSTGTGNLYINSQVWQVTPQSSSGFSSRISFIGQEGLAGPVGCNFTNLASQTGTIYLGPQNGNLIKNINLTYGFSFAFSRCIAPMGAQGWVAVDNNGGPSKTVFENIGAQNFYANWTSGIPSFVLGDTNTFIKPSFNNGCVGMWYQSSQAFINTVIDGVITNNITGINAALVDGVKVLGGNYSTICQTLPSCTGGFPDGAAFAVTGQSSTTGCGLANTCISMTITSPDSNLNSTSCGQLAGAALAEGVTWPAEWPQGNSCGYGVFMSKTTSHGIVPLFIVNFNPFTNVAVFGIPRDSFGIYENNCCGDLVSDILAQSTVYASSVSTPFFGNLQVEQVHVENDGLPLQLMCHCIGEFGSGRGAELKSVKLDSPITTGSGTVCCNQSPTDPQKAQFYATQVVPFINNTGIGGLTVGDITGGSDTTNGIQDPVLIAQGFSQLDWHHVHGGVYGQFPPVNLIGSQIGFPSFASGAPANGQLSGNYLLYTGGSAFGTGNFDNALMFVSPENVLATFVYGTQFLIDQWRGFMWGSSPMWGVRPAPWSNACILQAQATTLGGALPSITHTSVLQNVLPIISGGSGYSVNQVLTVSGGTGTAATLTVTSVGGGGAITGISVTTGGSYSTPPLGATLSVTVGAATFGPPYWRIGYTVAYPTLFGGQPYHVCDYKGGTGTAGQYAYMSTNQGYSYFQNLTTTNVPNLSWTMTGQSPFVYMNQEALQLMFPGLQIALTPTGGGASCTGNTWTAIVLEVHPTLGYIKTVGASADGSGYVPAFGGGLTCTGTTIVQQAPNLINPF